MGLFDSIKKQVQAVEQLPAVVDEAMAIQHNAQTMAAAQQAAFGTGAPVGGAPAASANLEPIAGVTIEQFAAVSKRMVGRSAEEVPGIVAEAGIAPDAWQQALDGWNSRMAAEPAVAMHYSTVYGAA